METEAQLIMQPASLRWLAQQHPTWTQQELAMTVGKSLAWVKKWLKRLREARAHGCDGLACSLSRPQDPTGLHRETSGASAAHSGDW